MKMCFVEQMLTRRSIRQFKNETVPEEVINNFVETGRLLPSATNTQPWHFVIVRDPNGKEACTFRGFNNFAIDASIVVVGFYK